MAARTTVLRLLTSKAPPLSTTAALSKRALFTSQAQKYYHSSPPWQADVSSQQGPQSQSPLAASVKAAASPPGDKAQASRQSKGEDENRNAAFLGEADSDDGFEADVEAYPDAHRHRLESVEASGMHGQSGESDAVYAPPRPQVALDGSNSAYLGEADSNDAHEADRALNPSAYSHNISDASRAAFLGEADSNDADAGDREIRPEAYRHQIEETGTSGLHGGPGEGDEGIPRGGAGRRFV